MSEGDFIRWLDAYGRAWETGDVAAVVVLFSPDAAYYETPFDPPMVGLEAIETYWREGAGQAQRDVAFRYHVLSVEGDLGLGHWSASFVRVPSGVRVRLDGILSARFDESGRCVEFREWWHRQEEATDA